MTRKQQFLERRLKYNVKMDRYSKSGGTTHYGLGQPIRRKGKHPLPLTGKQTGKRISAATNAAESPGLTANPPNIIVSGGGFGTPPHQHVVVPDLQPGDMYHAKIRRTGWYGGHQRRRKYMGRRPGRMTGAERERYFADLTFYLHGHFPAWDPLGRQPVGPAGGEPTLPYSQRQWP